MVVGDAEGTLLGMVNPAFAEMHGYTVEELTGRPIVDVFAPECRSHVQERVRIAHEKGYDRYETKHIRKDGTIFPVLVDVTTVTDGSGNVRYRIVTVQDITERKQIQELSEALNTINMAINSTLDFDEVMRRVIVESAKAMDADAAAIAVREGDRWIVKYLYGYAESVAGLCLPDKEVELILLVGRSEEPLAIRDVYDDERVDSALMRRHGVRSTLAIPLTVRGELIGVLRFVYTENPMDFTDAQIDIARKLAVSTSLSLENARFYAEK